MNHAEVEDAFAAAVTDPASATPAWALSPRGDVDAKRFAVYRNNVHVGLVGALRSKFPIVARLVGEEFFTAMARVFVGIDKPASPLLVEYGGHFPDFIAGFEPARMVPYLAEIARLEIAWTEAYHAADCPPLTIADVGAVAPADVLSLSFTPHPAAHLVVSDYPVGSIWSANQSAEVAPVKARGPEAVLITRPDVNVTLRVIAAADQMFCSELLHGSSVGDAAASVLETKPDFDLGSALVGLISTGAFASPITKGSPA